jgi:hypothetical protein
MSDADYARRVWWWPARELTPWERWNPCFLGGDEYGNRTLAVRLPGGLLIIALNIPLRTKMLDLTSED